MSFIEGIRDTFLYPAPAGPPPAAGYLTKIVMSCILISTLRSGYLSGLVSIFYGLGVLDKRYKVWYTANFLAGLRFDRS